MEFFVGLWKNLTQYIKTFTTEQTIEEISGPTKF